MSSSSTYSAGISRHRSQTIAPCILGPWRRPTKQLRLPPGRPINWPVSENATTKMSTSHFFHGSARGPGPKPISDEKCKVDIYNGHCFISILKKKNVPDSLRTHLLGFQVESGKHTHTATAHGKTTRPTNNNQESLSKERHAPLSGRGAIEIPLIPSSQKSMRGVWGIVWKMISEED